MEFEFMTENGKIRFNIKRGYFGRSENRTGKIKDREDTVERFDTILSETETQIILTEQLIKIRVEKENNHYFPVYSFEAGNRIMVYEKEEKKIAYRTEEWFYDTLAFHEFISRVLYFENKYIYGKNLSTSFFLYSTTATFKNLFDAINIGAIDKLEGMEKTMGLDFFRKTMDSDKFEITNAKKNHQVIGLPKQVVDFMKGNSQSYFEHFSILGKNNPNELIFLLEYYDTLKNVKNFKTEVADFEYFVRSLSQIKQIKEKTDLFKLVPYLISQRVYFNPMPAEKFCVPTNEARLYRDYLNLGGKDLYPPCLEVAERIINRNREILENLPLCEKFENIATNFKRYEWIDPKGEYVIVAPVKAEDFVNEGEKLHHCLSTYVELVANGVENVMFLRKKGEENVPFVTFSFAENFSIIEVKQIFNVEVEDEKVLDFLDRWKRRTRELVKKDTNGGI